MPRTTVPVRSWLLAGLLAVSMMACGPGFGPAGIELVVRQPPRNRVEVRGPPPGGRYVWISGHYAWQAGDYVWISGAWLLPPEERLRRWEPGHWARARGGWYWVEGHWR